MFYWLIDLSNTVPGFGVFRTFLNVFRYITFRTGGAIATGALFVFLFGPWIIDHLRLRQGKGQPIRTDGPQSHLLTKKGTPTMGGSLILFCMAFSTLLWCDLRNQFVWLALTVTVAFGGESLQNLPPCACWKTVRICRSSDRRSNSPEAAARPPGSAISIGPNRTTPERNAAAAVRAQS